MTTNSISSQLEQLNRLEANALSIMNAFNSAVTTSQETVTVTLSNEDGTTSDVVLPSNTFLHSEIQRLRQSLLNMSGLLNDQNNVIINVDEQSSFREVFAATYKQTFDAPTFSELTVGSQVESTKNALIERLLSPITNVVINLPIRFVSAAKVRITKFVLANTTDITNFSSGSTYAQTLQSLANLTYTRVDEIVDLEHRVSRYYGNFDVTAVTNNSDNTYTVTLNSINYNDIQNVVEGSRELQAGDQLVTNNGRSRFLVISVDARTNQAILSFVAGYQALTTGTNALEYLYIDANETRTVKVPIKYNERSIVFLSIEDDRTHIESAYSQSIVLNSSNFTVVQNNTTFSFDSYFNTYVSNLGQYFESLITEQNIPASLGVKPDKPTIRSTDFKVLQVNKHLTSTPATENIKKLNAEKAKTNSQILIINDRISALNERIAKGNFKSTRERTITESDLTVARNEKQRLSALYQSIVTDITTALSSDIAVVSPKYRVRGFWPVQPDITSGTTSAQKIVQYNVRYRYLANNADSADASSIAFTDTDGNNLTGTFSSWVLVKTNPLIKVQNANGQFVWQDNLVEDANQENINQLDIPINYGESVEIQVQAISEAGYPISPKLSDYSDIVRIEFPDELLIETDANAISTQNESDRLAVAVQKEFDTQGITEHIGTAVQEQDKYFAHDSRQVASGFLTPEQKIVSLFDKLREMTQQITSLQELVNRRAAEITVELQETNNTVRTINNFTKLEIFAGYYTDNVDITDATQFGSIVEKVFYIRLNNKNSSNVELLSLSPGGLSTDTTTPTYSNVPISYLGSEETPRKQKNGQILYLRNTDISSSNELYVTNGVSSNVVPVQDQDDTALPAAKTIVSLTDTNTIETVALKQTASLTGYSVLTTSHPTYVQYLADSNITPLAAEFDRISYLNDKLRADTQQNAYNANQSPEFLANDRYLVGANTIGSKLFMRVNDQAQIQVDGIDTLSNKVIQPGDSNAILIPIVFQYRMTDAAGFINGNSTLTTNANFTYTKSIGIDLLIANQAFKFDVTISAKFRPTSVSNNNLGVSSVQNAIDSTSSTAPTVE